MGMAYLLGMQEPLHAAVPKADTLPIGGILPMIPYFAFTNVYLALYTSMGVTVVILILFGYLKANLFGATALQSFKSAVFTLVYGINHSSI